MLARWKIPPCLRRIYGEVVKRRAFVAHSNLVEMCLDDAAETSPRPFMELLEQDPGKDEALWERQRTALQILERMDSMSDTWTRIRMRRSRTFDRTENTTSQGSRWWA